MTHRMRVLVVPFILVGCLSSQVVLGQTDLSKFPLVKAIPADVFIAVAAKGNPERQFLTDYWAEVHKAFIQSEILEDAWDLITDAVPDENLEEVEELRDRFGELCGSVDWGGLFEKEMIYAGRLSPPPQGTGLVYQGLLMARLSKDKAKANYAALKVLLEEIQKLIALHFGPEVVGLLTEATETTETKEDGVTLTMLGPAGMPGMGVTLAYRKDVLALSFGSDTILRDAMGLLKGASEKSGLSKTKRFKKAFSELPEAEDSLVFLDIDGMLKPIQSLFQGIAEAQKLHAGHGEDEPDGDGHAEGDHHEGEPDDGRPLLKIATGLLDDISLLDTMATVEWTDGYRVFTESLTTLRPDAKSKPLYGVLNGGKGIKRFERFIPEEASDFGCTTFIDLSKLYRYVLDFVRTNVPDGAENVAEFEKMQQEEWELDIDKDILALFDGPIFWVTIGDDSTFMAKVNDEERMAKQISRLLDVVNGALGQENALMTTEIEVAGKAGFIQISHPMMIMMGGLKPPVVGTADGFFMLGSSAGVVETCIQTRKGDHPNITKSKRWRKEGLAPKSGAVDSISFTDESNLAAELQQLIGGLSMGLGMVGMLAQDLPPEARSVFAALPPMLSKLVPVVGELDFYQSSASFSSFDGERWRTHSVQNYKEPTPKQAIEETEDKPRATPKGETAQEI